MNTIGPLQLIPQTIKAAQHGSPQSSQSPPWQNGQLLKATVLESLGQNRFLLQAGDNRLVAQSEVNLKAGQNLQLQLTSTSPHLQLKIVGDTLNQLVGRSLTLIGNSINLDGLANSLPQPLSLLSSLSSQTRQTLAAFLSLTGKFTTSDNGGAQLKQLIDNLGLGFENMLSRGDSFRAQTSLKSALFEILLTLRANPQAQEKAGQLLTTLEFFQLAQLQTDTQQQFLFPLPFSFIEQGYLLIERRRDEQGGKGEYENQEYRFTLHVQLTPIGNLQVDFFHTPEGLFIRFHTDSEEVSSFIKGFAGELESAISDLPILGLSFAADATDPAAELINLLVPPERSVLNTTA